MALESLCGVTPASFNKGGFYEDEVNLEKALKLSSSFQVPVSINVSLFWFYHNIFSWKGFFECSLS